MGNHAPIGHDLQGAGLVTIDDNLMLRFGATQIGDQTVAASIGVLHAALIAINGETVARAIRRDTTGKRHDVRCHTRDHTDTL